MAASRALRCSLVTLRFEVGDDAVLIITFIPPLALCPQATQYTPSDRGYQCMDVIGEDNEAVSTADIHVHGCGHLHRTELMLSVSGDYNEAVSTCWRAGTGARR